MKHYGCGKHVMVARDVASRYHQTMDEEIGIAYTNQRDLPLPPQGGISFKYLTADYFPQLSQSVYGGIT